MQSGLLQLTFLHQSTLSYNLIYLNNNMEGFTSFDLKTILQLIIIQ